NARTDRAQVRRPHVPLDGAELACDSPGGGRSMGLGSRVLVATDLSDGADEAIRQGHARASAEQGELVVCTVVPNALRNNPLFPQRAEQETLELVDAQRRAAQQVTERVAALTGRAARQEGAAEPCHDGAASGPKPRPLAGPDTFRVVVDNGSPEAA